MAPPSRSRKFFCFLPPAPSVQDCDPFGIAEPQDLGRECGFETCRRKVRMRSCLAPGSRAFYSHPPGTLSVPTCGQGQSVRIEGFREQTPIPLSPRGIQISPLRRVSNSKCSRSDSHGPWQESSLYCSHTRLYSINKQIQSRRERRPPPGLTSEPSTESLLSQGERLPIMQVTVR